MYVTPEAQHRSCASLFRDKEFPLTLPSCRCPSWVGRRHTWGQVPDNDRHCQTLVSCVCAAWALETSDAPPTLTLTLSESKWEALALH